MGTWWPVRVKPPQRFMNTNRTWPSCKLILIVALAMLIGVMLLGINMHINMYTYERGLKNDTENVFFLFFTHALINISPGNWVRNYLYPTGYSSLYSSYCLHIVCRVIFLLCCPSSSFLQLVSSLIKRCQWGRQEAGNNQPVCQGIWPTWKAFGQTLQWPKENL